MRDYFPFFKRRPDITYLDSAATSQTLYTVAEDQRDFMLDHKSNAHRSGNSMGTYVDQQYQLSKELIGKWLNINKPEKRVVFNSGTTQGLNDAAQMIISAMEGGGVVFLGIDSHHSLILPWTQSGNAKWRVVYVELDKDGRLDLNDLSAKIKAEPMGVSKVIAATAVSNVLGLVNDLDGIKKIALECAAVSIIDASQIISKRQLNLSGFDFVVWSWHKVYGPMGLGCLLIDPVWLNFDPVRPGGGTVTSVSVNSVLWTDNATKFESGTQNLSAICALPKLVNWLIEHQTDIETHDISLAKVINDQISLAQFTPTSKTDSGLLCLEPVAGTVEDYTMMLDAKNIMIRSGKLCAEPLITQISNGALLRLSWGCYTTRQEIELALDNLGDIHARLSKHVQRAV
jgi:cysteine desulfurase/selenocysteine lyase